MTAMPADDEQEDVPPAKLEVGQRVEGPGQPTFVVTGRACWEAVWRYVCEEGVSAPVPLAYPEPMLREPDEPPPGKVVKWGRGVASPRPPGRPRGAGGRRERAARGRGAGKVWAASRNWGRFIRRGAI